PSALVDHRQPAYLQLLHVPHCLGEVIVISAAMDAWGHHVARRRAAGIETVPRQSFADDVTVGHHADQPVVLSNGNGAYVMLTHQFREFGDRRVWTNPVDALVHCIFDFHGRPPLLKLVYQPRFPSPFDYNTDRFLLDSQPPPSGVFLIPQRTYCRAHGVLNQDARLLGSLWQGG